MEVCLEERVKVACQLQRFHLGSTSEGSSASEKPNGLAEESPFGLVAPCKNVRRIWVSGSGTQMRDKITPPRVYLWLGAEDTVPSCLGGDNPGLTIGGRCLGGEAGRPGR